MRRAKSIALIVPSAHAWEESNALLNPEHPEFSKLIGVRSRLPL
jgi:RES domain-containing protein